MENPRPLLDPILHSFVTFLVILDPIGVAVVFAGMTRDETAAYRRHTAWQATMIAGILVFTFGLIGEAVFQGLGVSMAAFRIAGGILLFLLATDMVFARPSGIRNPTAPEQKEASRQRDISVFPLAFPLLAGPGALTSVVLSVGQAHTPLQTGGVFLALAVVLAITLACLLAASRMMRLLGVTGANVVGRVLGVILAALATQYVVDGILEIVRSSR